MKPFSFSWRYKSLFGVEGSFSLETRKLSAVAIFLGGVIKLSVGLSIFNSEDTKE